MAALWYAAGKLSVRTLRRRQAAVISPADAEWPAWVSRRFLHGAPPADGAQPPTSVEDMPNLSELGRRTLYLRLRKIHKKREELYDMSAAVQRNYSIPSSVGRENKQLVRSLAALVDDRPNDPIWLLYRTSRRMNLVLKCSWAVLMLYLFMKR